MSRNACCQHNTHICINKEVFWTNGKKKGADLMDH